MRWGTIVGIAAALQAATSAAMAQDPVEQFYRGKSIAIYIGSSAGGGYDAYARALGRHMGKYIPGNPTIVPQNMPGAGGNKAAGYVYSVAPKDGTAMGALFPGGILAPLLGDAAIQHDPTSRSKYAVLRSRGHSHARALRTVADRLLNVACAMLKAGTTFDVLKAQNRT